MVQLDLTAEERALLIEVLQNRVSDFRMEIAATDSQDFREELKKRKEVVKKVLAVLTESAG